MGEYDSLRRLFAGPSVINNYLESCDYSKLSQTDIGYNIDLQSCNLTTPLYFIHIKQY